MSGKTTNEIIEAINNATLSSPHWIDEEFPELGNSIAEVDEDEHRWYTVKTCVFRYGDDYIGVTGPTSLKSESMGYEDAGVECIAFEMKQIQAVSYVAVKEEEK